MWRLPPPATVVRTMSAAASNDAFRASPHSGVNSCRARGRGPHGYFRYKICEIAQAKPHNPLPIFKRIEGEDPMSDWSELMDRSVLERLVTLMRRKHWLRAMDIGRDPQTHPTLTRLIKRGFVERRPRPGMSPNLAPDDQSSRRHEYKISDAGLNFLRRSKGE